MSDQHPSADNTERRHQERIVIEAVTAALQKIADASAGVLAHDIVAAICERVFVTTMHHILLKRGGHVAHTQVALLTGIDAEKVREHLDSRQNQRHPPLTVEERIVKLWTEDPDFLVPSTGRPAHLRKYGASGSFRILVNRVVRGVTPNTAIDSLLAAGVIKLIGDSRVELPDPNWTPLLNHEQLVAIRKLQADRRGAEHPGGKMALHAYSLRRGASGRWHRKRATWRRVRTRS